ncbi:hypothetical protein Nepgr_005988 [Nepenthes gracilis]|uniref:Pentatricopeptide repeat-containing protein n=1 Tax=Nepenthes gracilis TaxID=150966 RepID=A0AAD3S4L0_NEPGR|nr:hypothetical protein Nepgr_005988 [Nepenthes gracilis]
MGFYVLLTNLLSLAFRRKKAPVFSAPFDFRTNYHSLQFNHLLDSCSSLRDLEQIHALIITSGSLRLLTLATKLVSSASTWSPTMDYAQKMFDKMPERDVFSWNTLIRGYANMGPCREALILYKNMHQAGLLPDSYTFPFVVRSCAVISAMREGKQAHCNVIKSGFNSDVFVRSSLVAMYSQGGEILNMELVFEEQVTTNIVSLTSMIAGYVQNGFLREGLGVFLDMLASGSQPNAVTLVSVLPACAGLELFNMGRLIHGFGVKMGADSEISFVNALIALYGKQGNVDMARSLFDQMQVRTLVSWNAIIAAYEQNDAGGNAVKIFLRMQHEKVEYDYITMVTVISACTSLGALGTGRWIHELVKNKGLKTNVSIQNALIDMYSKCGNIELAMDVFEGLPYKSVVSYTALIGACASHGRAVDALKLFSKMKELGIMPNSFTFIAVLTACRHAGLIAEGKKHFESMMKDYSIVPGSEHCACVVDLLGRSGSLEEAYEFVLRMPVEPDVGVWGALLGACRIHGNVELAELVSKRVFQLGPPTVSFHVLMFHIFAEAGRWDDAHRMRKMMDRELEKIPGHSLVEVNRIH